MNDCFLVLTTFFWLVNGETFKLLFLSRMRCLLFGLSKSLQLIDIVDLRMILTDIFTLVGELLKLSCRPFRPIFRS